MTLKLLIIMSFTAAGFTLSSCAPIVLAAAGAGGVIVADKAIEDEDGGDGLF